MVNPGRLAKSQTGGTYARIVISPETSTKNKDDKSIVDMIAAQVRRI